MFPQILFHPKSYFFLDSKHHAKFRNPTIAPSGRKVTQGERKRKERKKGEQAGAELCQAQFKLGLAKPSQLCQLNPQLCLLHHQLGQPNPWAASILLSQLSQSTFQLSMLAYTLAVYSSFFSCQLSQSSSQPGMLAYSLSINVSHFLCQLTYFLLCQA